MLTVVADMEGAFGTALAHGPDGDRWALADGTAVQLGSGTELGELITAPDQIHHLAFTPDGRHLLACPNVFDLDDSTWTSPSRLDAALVADLDAPPHRRQLGIVSGAFADDGRELAVVTRFQHTRELGVVDSYDGPLERLLFVARDGELRGVLSSGTEEIRAVGVSDRHVAAGGASVTVWDRSTLGRLAVLEHHERTVRALAFDRRERLAAIDADGDVSVSDAAAGEVLKSWHGHDDDGTALAWHPTLAVLATGGTDNVLRLWSPDGALLHEHDLGGWPTAISFDATGARLAAVAYARPPHLMFFAVDELPLEATR